MGLLCNCLMGALNVMVSPVPCCGVTIGSKCPLNIPILASGWYSVMVSPVPSSGVIIGSKCPLNIPILSLQGGLVLHYPLSPVAELLLVASVPSSYLAGVIECLDEYSLAPSFVRNPASKQASNTRTYNLQASAKHLV